MSDRTCLRYPSFSLPAEWGVHRDHVVAYFEGPRGPREWILVASRDRDGVLSFMLRDSRGWAASVGLLADHPYVEHADTCTERFVPAPVRGWAADVAAAVEDAVAAP